MELNSKILQSQIDRAKASGDTHNVCGVPMKKQIKGWEKKIAANQRVIDRERRK